MNGEPRSFTVVSKGTCSWCDRAKELLSRFGHAYVENTLVDMKSALEFFAQHPSIPRTVPQIWEGEEYIGGYTDLVKHLGLARAGA